MPSPMSGTLTTWMVMSGLPPGRPKGGLCPLWGRRTKVSPGVHLCLHHAPERLAHAVRTGEVGPLLRMRVGRVPSGYAFDRRLEVEEAVLLHQRCELGSEAARTRCLVDD